MSHALVLARLSLSSLLLALTASLILASCKMARGKRPSNLHFNDGQAGRGPGIAVIGDSLSTGVLASTRLGQELDRDLITNYNRFHFGNDHTSEASQAEFSEYSNSAMTSDGDWGLRAMIARRHGLFAKDIPLYFAAQWGGRLMHLPKHLANLKTLYARREGKPAEYVLIMIGGNDFCRGVEPAAFAEKYEEGVQAILSLHPSSHVLFSLIPPLAQALAHQHSYSPTLSCMQFRKWFCSPILVAGAEARLAGFNDAISAVAMKHKNFYAGTIALVGGVREMQIEKSDLAYDCFHPSLEAHKKFATYFATALDG